MKKMIALFGLLAMVTSCDIDDDGPRYHTTYSEVVALDHPEYFVVGQTDTLSITYRLPSACHQGLGVQSNRGQGSDEERRNIYLAGVVNVEANLSVCDIEASEEDLLEVSEAILQVNEAEPYTFHLFKGIDDINNEPIYESIEVPVYEEDSVPEPEPEE